MNAWYQMEQFNPQIIAREAMATISFRLIKPVEVDEVFTECGYCLDAPEFIPAGASQCGARRSRIIWTQRP